MSKRMTAAEVAAELRRQANQSATRAQAVASHPTDAARIYGVWCDAYMAAAYLVEQHLTPQVLDEPDGDGDYWIEGREGVHRVGGSAVRQMWHRQSSAWWESLEKVRVAKVPPGPFSTLAKSPEPAD